MSYAEGKFKINTTCAYYRELVSSHAVLDRPVCPASMYLECAAMAVQSMGGDVPGKCLSFTDFAIDAPLGVDQRRNVVIEMERRLAKDDWGFWVYSNSGEDPDNKSVTHAKGVLTISSLQSSAQTSHYERLIHHRIASLRMHESRECLKSTRIYSLFGRIVSYGSPLKGVKSIDLVQKESIAEVHVPPRTLTKVSTAGTICDAVVFDNFFQVVGVSLNIGEDCGIEEAFVAVGIDNMQISASCDFLADLTWTVYASFTILDGSHARADVAVISALGTFAASISGVQFVKLRFKTLRNLLDAANGGSGLHSPQQEVGRDSNSEKRTVEAEPSDTEMTGLESRLRDLLKSILDLSGGEILAEIPLGDPGMDSLGAAEIVDTLQDAFKVEEDLTALSEMTYRSLCSLLGAGTSTSLSDTPAESDSSQSNILRDADTDLSNHEELHPEPDSLSENERSTTALSLSTLLCKSSSSFHQFASQRAFSQYWNIVAPQQDELTASYILEALRQLDVDLYTLQGGQIVRSPQVLSKHTKVQHRFWQILKQLSIVQIDGPTIIRSSVAISFPSATSLLRDIRQRYPAFNMELDLMELTGPRLADCLTGKIDAARILFANARSQEILRANYTETPQLACATDLLLRFIEQIILRNDAAQSRILEVGGGFAGTTAPLAQLLSSLNRPISYTFTDVSPKLVKAAKARLSIYPWMDFQVLDLDKDPPASLLNRYDLVIGTNVVHATSNIVKSCSRLRLMLRDEGIIALSEVTCKVKWYDIVSGLLEGWWCATDGRDYPLQSPEH